MVICRDAGPACEVDEGGTLAVAKSLRVGMGEGREVQIVLQ